MSKIYLIRHAFTPANNTSYNNQESLWQIASDRQMPIEKKYGVKQALELGDFLRGLKGNILILSSPYVRVCQTLKYAISRTDFDYDIKVLDELSEFNSGIHYAHTKEEMLRLHPESKQYYLDAEKDYDNAVYIGGESRNELKARVRGVASDISSLALSNKYDYVLVFAHGMVNKYIYYWMTGDYSDHYMQNCEVLSVSDRKTLFVPKTLVPKGFMVDIADYSSDKNGFDEYDMVLTKKG